MESAVVTAREAHGAAAREAHGVTAALGADAEGGRLEPSGDELTMGSAGVQAAAAVEVKAVAAMVVQAGCGAVEREASTWARGWLRERAAAAKGIEMEAAVKQAPDCMGAVDLVR